MEKLYGPVEFTLKHEIKDDSVLNNDVINNEDEEDLLSFDRYKFMKRYNPFILDSNDNSNTAVEICDDVGHTVLRITFDKNNLKKLFKSNNNGIDYNG